MKSFWTASLLLYSAVACSSSPTTTPDAGNDGAPEEDAGEDVEQDTAPPPAACDEGAKAGSPTGGVVKTAKNAANVTVRVPSTYDPLVGSPLIVVYAPAVASGPQTETFTGLTPKATARGYIIAYVDHISPQYDTNFVEAASAIASVENSWCVDPKRVFLTGHSDGGSLSEIIVLKGLATVTSIAPSAAGVNIGYISQAKCPDPSIPEMEIHSKGDALFPVADGFGAKVGAWWAQCAGCDPTPSAPDAVGCVVYGTCANSLEVRYCENSLQHGQWYAKINDPMLDFFDRWKLP